MGVRRSIIAVIGDAGIKPNDKKYILAEKLGKLLIDNGYRIIHGGLRGVMEAVSKGARSSAKYSEGDIIGVLPSSNRSDVNKYVDIIIPTGLDIGRNIIVSNAEAIIAIGGGAGTLTEIAIAWQLKRLIIAFNVSGWSGKLANKRIDHRMRYEGIPDDKVYGVNNEIEVIKLLRTLLPKYNKKYRMIK